MSDQPQRYFINFTDIDGTNTDWIECDGAAFSRLAAGRAVLMTPRGPAIYKGRGNLPITHVDGPAEWLQFLDVPFFALVPSAVEQDAPHTLLDMTQAELTAHNDTERARLATEAIINGITVEGFENDADAATVVRGQFQSILGVIERVINERPA